MSFFVLFLTALALAMDALAVAIATGVSLQRVRFSQAMRMALCFGFFQALMPVVGWYAGSSVHKYIVDYDHWIAFVLLFGIGAHMIWESVEAIQKTVREGDCCCEHGKTTENDPTRGKILLMLGIATSIDALAVGISLSMVDSGILIPALLIGLVCFIISFIGVYLGGFACRYHCIGRYAGVIGGLVLIAIGVRILFEHGVFS